MKCKKLKQTLLALVCAFTMMSAGMSVNAMETVEADDTYMSARLTGSCGCNMKVETMSLRSCVDNKDGTHTSVYNTAYVCPHNRVDRIETIKETHAFSGYQDGGHVFEDPVKKTGDKNEHLYTRICRCGATDPLTLLCHGGTNSGGHAKP